ncbi:hypothetical protein Hypma_004899 [Hypsizygus marmoreus]|uniref:Uncharacterized protein n=1 Tax=Hypsizygus marmoreus TaxID=39966 RepID=A0A369KAF1_HYPMA|nr:hypothetical protein Hypma_004899 [Hypsizygus marmoreus]
MVYDDQGLTMEDEETGDMGGAIDEDPGYMSDDLDDDDMYHFIPMEPEPGEGEAGPGPSTHRNRRQDAIYRSLDDDDDARVTDEHPSAGRCIQMDKHLHDKYRQLFGHGSEDKDGDILMDGTEPNSYAPFASELDWRVAQWAIKDSPGHAAFDRLLDIPGVKEKLGLSYHNIRKLHQIVDSIPERAGEWKTKHLRFKDRPGEKFTIRHRNVIKAIQSLWGSPELADDIVYVPKKVFSDSSRENRIFSEMWTAQWWHVIQNLLPDGATVAPVIIATDKTQLTQFSGNKSAYPVYLTLGNIPKALRRKPSKHACILIAYLSVEKISRAQLTQQEHRARGQRLFHESMRIVLSPLIKAGKEGVEMTGGNGEVRRIHPILSCYVADYPEQCLVACSKNGTCPKCQTAAKELQEMEGHEPRTQKWTRDIIIDAKNTSNTLTQFHSKCMDREVSGSINTPFWTDFPFTDIHRSITPDVLHQLYQGVLKHLINWCRRAMTPAELDRRIRSLPPAYGVRHFKNGITALSQISGTERKNMAKILLGCLAGAIPQRGILAVKSILDFIYLAQYSTHDSITLGYMEDALNLWEANRVFFLETGIRGDFNIPKFHSLLHYIESIKMFGTTDNYNTELFEHLHIDFAKLGWRASNHRDEFPQMITWLSRREKLTSFEVYLSSSHYAQLEHPLPISQRLPISIAKFPNQNKSLSAIEVSHHAPGFERALKEHLNLFLTPRTSNQTAALYPLPFKKLDIYHQFKFHPSSLQDDEEESDIVKAIPISKTNPHGRFDTVIVLKGDAAEATGVAGTQVGRVKVIFCLPSKLDYGLGPMDAPPQWPQGPLAYVEWFSKFKASPGNHGMYSVKKTDSPGILPLVSIVPLTSIRQSCMLIPQYSLRPAVEEQSWTTDTVLDSASSFLVNNWQNMYAFQTIY